MPETMFRQPPNPNPHFSQVPFADIERSTFDRSHGLKGTVQETGQLIPIYWDEVLPGDTFNMNATVFARLATPLKPFMDNLQIDIHHFFVPNYILWDKWQQFMGEVRGKDDDPDLYSIPQAIVNPAQYGTIGDYLGLPLGQGTADFQVNDLPFRAYEMIWYEWYRDQNIQLTDDVPDPENPGPIDRRLQLLRFRNKRRDYFTSCLPWPQKGDPVLLPLATQAPVVADPDDGRPLFRLPNNGNDVTYIGIQPGGDSVSADWTGGGVTGATDIAEWAAPQLIADLTNAESVSINDLRTAFQIQRLLERDARGGTRYIELVLSHFGVQSADGRVWRPEMIGLGTGMMNINPIASTVADQTPGSEVPQGNLAAVGTGIAKGGFSHSFTEHGIVMTMMSLRSDLTYQQGLSKFFTRKTRYDYYWPVLSHLGEQPVLQKELYFDSDATAEVNDTIFGYQERYAEYRYSNSKIVSDMRSNAANSLDVWHLGQDFEEAPILNGAFINEKPPIDRVIAVPSEPKVLIDCWFDLKCTRPMPVYSVPGMIDHF